jgi:hypothetical protein
VARPFIEKEEPMSIFDTVSWARREAERQRREAAAEARRARSAEQAADLAAGLRDVERVEVVDVDPFAGPPDTWPDRVPAWYMDRFRRRR